LLTDIGSCVVLTVWHSAMLCV